MKHSLFILAIIGAVMFLTAPLAHGASRAKDGKKANCELRLVSAASAGEAFLSIFTRNEEECLSKADSQVEAKYRNARGTETRRGGAGPQP